jgi:hypothetical protein
LRTPDCSLFFSLFTVKVVFESGSMALHRDIYWVGRQWAVTGFGVQAVDQRLTGAFDIELSQLWDDDLSARTRRYAWINLADFDKAVAIARERFPASPKKSSSLVDSVLELMQQPAPTPLPRPKTPAPDPVVKPILGGGADAKSQQDPPLPVFQLHVQGQLARFMPQWRIRR